MFLLKLSIVKADGGVVSLRLLFLMIIFSISQTNFKELCHVFSVLFRLSVNKCHNFYIFIYCPENNYLIESCMRETALPDSYLLIYNP